DLLFCGFLHGTVALTVACARGKRWIDYQFLRAMLCDAAPHSGTQRLRAIWVTCRLSTAFSLASALPSHSCRDCCAAVEGASVPEAGVASSAALGHWH